MSTEQKLGTCDLLQHFHMAHKESLSCVNWRESAQPSCGSELLPGIRCSRPIGHGGTHWCKELNKEAGWNDRGAAQPEALPRITASTSTACNCNCNPYCGCECHHRGAAPARELSAEQFYRQWPIAIFNQSDPLVAMLEFAEAYAQAVRQSVENDFEDWARAELVKVTAERDALKEQVDDLADTLHRANVNYAGWVEKVARAEAALREAREALNKIGFTEQHLDSAKTARWAIIAIDKVLKAEDGTQP